ncbi:hypothetical protein : [Tuwongella immobilis]|uniref:FHA domain-containing protein n=2 Tax=Tuwongella immobilis TaxID=692036 RepID=A0A6C2YMY6_9BACT|nr:hypothetical protein : [Tuwongella immobilis]VTS00902.1 hypothetical protein : [Tuwongella immobilis]
MPMVRLEFRHGTARPVLYEMAGDEFLMGSVPGCDLRLPGSNLPPVVCVMNRSPEGVRIRKLAPTLAVHVNGRPIPHATPTPIQHGDHIGIGAVELLIQVEMPETTAHARLIPVSPPPTPMAITSHAAHASPVPSLHTMHTPAPQPAYARPGSPFSTTSASSAVLQQLQQEAAELRAKLVDFEERQRSFDSEEDSRKAEWVRRQQELDRRQQEIESLQSQMAEQAAELEADRMLWYRRRQEMEREFTAPRPAPVSTTAMTELRQREEMLQRAQTELRERLEQIEHENETYRQREIALSRGEEQLRQREEAIRQGEQSLRQRESAILEGEQQSRRREESAKAIEMRYRDREQSLESLRTQLERREQELLQERQRMEQEARSLAETRDSLLEMRQQFQDRYQQTREQLSQMHQSVQSTTEQLRDREQSLQREIDRHRTQLESQFNQRLAAAEMELERRRQQLEAEFHARRQLQEHDRAELERQQIPEWHARKAELQAGLDRLQERKAQLEAEYAQRSAAMEAEFQARQERFQQEVIQLAPRLQEASERLEQLRVMDNELLQRREALSQEWSELEREKAQFESVRASVIERDEERERDWLARLAQLELRENALLASRQEVERLYSQSQADLQRVEREKATLEQKQSALQERAKEIDQRFEQLQSDTREFEAQARTLDAQQEQCRIEAERLARQKNDQELQSSRLAERAAQLEGQQAMLAALRTRLERIREEMRAESAQMADERSRHDKLSQELAKRSEELESLRSQLTQEHQGHGAERRMFSERSELLQKAMLQLKQLQERLSEQESRLQQRSEELDARAAEQAEQSGLLKARAQQLVEMQESLEADRASLRERESMAHQGEDSRRQMQEQLRRRTEELTQRAAQIEEQSRQLQAQHDALEAERAELEELRSQGDEHLHALRQELEHRASELEQYHQALTHREDTLRRQVERLKEAGQAIAADRKALFENRARSESEQRQSLERLQKNQTFLDDYRRSVLAETTELLRQLPDLEKRGQIALERMQQAREQLQGNLGELHETAEQSKAELEHLRRDVQTEIERLRREEQNLGQARSDHRQSVAAFRQQLIEWQSRIAEIKQLVADNESRMAKHALRMTPTTLLPELGEVSTNPPSHDSTDVGESPDASDGVASPNGVPSPDVIADAPAIPAAISENLSTNDPNPNPIVAELKPTLDSEIRSESIAENEPEVIRFSDHRIPTAESARESEVESEVETGSSVPTLPAVTYTPKLLPPVTPNPIAIEATDDGLHAMRQWYRAKLHDLATGSTGVLRLPPSDSGPVNWDEELDPGDKSLGEKLRRLDLVDEPTLHALWSEALRQRCSLKQLLLTSGVVTLHQLAMIDAGHLDKLMLGSFRVLDRLAKLPRETLYRVLDPERQFGVDVATLRHLAESEMQDAIHPDEYRSRFAAAASIQHPNVAATLAVLEINQRPAVLQEVNDGVPGNEWPELSAKPAVWVKLVSQAAAGLTQAHAAGLVHGHLSARSFLMTPLGVVKLQGIGEPDWLFHHRMPREDGTNADPTPADDLLALGRVALLWATADTGESKPKIPKEIKPMLERLGAFGPPEQPFRDGDELMTELSALQRKLKDQPELWSNFMHQIRGDGTGHGSESVPVNRRSA